MVLLLPLLPLLPLQLLNTIDSGDLMWIPMLAMLIMLTFLCVSCCRCFSFSLYLFSNGAFFFWFLLFSQTTMNRLSAAVPHSFFSVRSRISRLHIKLRNSNSRRFRFVRFIFQQILLLLFVVVVSNRIHIVIDLISQNRIRFAVFVSLWAAIHTSNAIFMHEQANTHSYEYTHAHTQVGTRARAKYRCQFANYMAYDFCEQTHSRTHSHTLFSLWPNPWKLNVNVNVIVMYEIINEFIIINASAAAVVAWM